MVDFNSWINTMLQFKKKSLYIKIRLIVTIFDIFVNMLYS